MCWMCCRAWGALLSALLKRQLSRALVLPPITGWTQRPKSSARTQSVPETKSTPKSAPKAAAESSACPPSDHQTDAEFYVLSLKTKPPHDAHSVVSSSCVLSLSLCIGASQQSRGNLEASLTYETPKSLVKRRIFELNAFRCSRFMLLCCH